ncbi:MAG TPA: sugar ABC transporter ATP-binding protein [Blastocatellia bacterium]|nr:sugar ABC transporter ATP-binding protein [Blastocatellia bacterium]
MLLTATDITKAFAGVQALRSACLELRAGEVHALVGENGAGKSTLVKIITGAVQPDGGEITLDGETIRENSPLRAKSRGIVAIYQQPALFPELTVAENIALGLERARSWHRIDWKYRRSRAADLLHRVGARIDPEAIAADLTMPQQQLVEIARAIGADARIFIMDEPTASLSEEESQNLFRVIRELLAQSAGIIYISHRLDELQMIADRVTVLRDGKTIDTLDVSKVTREELIRLMVGREVSTVFPKKSVSLGETILELDQVGCSASGIVQISFTVRAGEIVGLAGLVGAGRTELARTLFGLTPADSGTILLRGQPVSINSPAQAIKLGLAYVPEDRRRHGVILDMPISANTTLAALSRITRFGFIDLQKERDTSLQYAGRLAIKTQSLFSPVAALSGGNQQKVALSRWLVTRPAVLILDEPTQGIDVGAKAEIHTLMGELAEQGIAIIMISSELPEVIAMSDRVVVMHAGRITGILDRAEATQAKILALALGHEPTDEPHAIN